MEFININVVGFSHSSQRLNITIKVGYRFNPFELTTNLRGNIS